MVNSCTSYIQFLCFPPKCLVCGAPGEQHTDLCQGCIDDLPRNYGACPVCSAPLPEGVAPGTPCGSCQQDPPPFDSAIAPYLFTGPVSRLVGRFKFNSQLQYGALLSRLLQQEIEARQPEMPELLVPVPLHSSRLRERGFNQALELARPLAKAFGTGLDHTCIQRIKATPHQIGLQRRARMENVKGAFELRGEIHADHVALVDDVITTGSTLREIAGLLKAAGVSRVDIWSVARTPAHN
ncbi:MAG: ComF family protein [Sedimenticola sp.]